jgi:superfamily II DNA or RNA helicase
MHLFDYQRRLVELYRAATDPRPLLVLPPGGGKTFTGLECVRGTERVIWAAHRTELLQQADRQAAALGIPILTMTIQGLLSMPQKPQGLFVWDEAHHSVAEEWSELLKYYPRMLGLTATPENSKGVGLGAVYTSIHVGASFKELIELGRLVPIEVIAPNKLLKAGQVAQHPVKAYQQHTPGEKAILFAPNVATAMQYAIDFKNAGISAAYVHGEMGKRERERIIADYCVGRYLVLTNALLLTEGFDDPPTSVVIIARGCSTPGTWIQTTMRCGRSFTGKSRGTVLDLRGVSHVHGDPTEERIYSLTGRGIRRKVDLVDARYCQVCGALWSGLTCEECGNVIEPPTPPKVVNAKLEKRVYLPKATEADKVQRLAMLIVEAKKKGYKDNWPGVRFKILYGAWPSVVQKNAAYAKLKPSS